MMRARAKYVVGKAVASSMPIARYENMIFVLSHMRAATTAFSNVLCTCPEVSGYGETHVSYRSESSVGQTVVNLARRRAWRMGCNYILDKVLHNELHAGCCEAFYSARGIFLIRSPRPTIASILHLAQLTEDQKIRTEYDAAVYYLTRVQCLNEAWDKFPPDRRLGLVSEALVSDPEACMKYVGSWLGFKKNIGANYVSHPASHRPGGGDPVTSGTQTKIIKTIQSIDLSPIPGVRKDLSEQCVQMFLRLRAKFSGPKGCAVNTS